MICSFPSVISTVCNMQSCYHCEFQRLAGYSSYCVLSLVYSVRERARAAAETFIWTGHSGHCHRRQWAGPSLKKGQLSVILQSIDSSLRTELSVILESFDSILRRRSATPFIILTTHMKYKPPGPGLGVLV